MPHYSVNFNIAIITKQYNNRLEGNYLPFQCDLKDN